MEYNIIQTRVESVWNMWRLWLGFITRTNTLSRSLPRIRCLQEMGDCCWDFKGGRELVFIEIKMWKWFWRITLLVWMSVYTWCVNRKIGYLRNTSVFCVVKCNTDLSSVITTSPAKTLSVSRPIMKKRDKQPHFFNAGKPQDKVGVTGPIFFWGCPGQRRSSKGSIFTGWR